MRSSKRLGCVGCQPRVWRVFALDAGQPRDAKCVNQPKLGFRVLAGFGGCGKVKAVADGFGDIAEGDAFFCDGVEDLLLRLLFGDQAV
ncbi:hypothetical protein ACQ86N_36030 [Puia sp. P3]|uniref:hypothetical protein n=1 Tax=Puia sp. P3 TaxID=3423952 RepID=UPI003D678B78